MSAARDEAGDDAAAWRRRFERERAARKEAESLLHVKSREIFTANEALAQRAHELDASLSQLMQAKAALVEREKMAALGGLVAGVAHEINTPLGVALTAASLAQERLEELRVAVAGGATGQGGLRTLVGELDEALALVNANLERAASLVRNFKMVAVDKSSNDVRPASPAELVQGVVASLRPMLRRARAEARVEATSEAQLKVAAGSLLQVLTNLVQNACVHAFEGVEGARTVTISARLEPQRLVLSVADNGLGMTPEVAARAHEPFFTTRRGSGGSGLGLAIVHNIVAERFGGTIHLETAPGAGTTWTLVLPLGTPALARAEGSASA